MRLFFHLHDGSRVIEDIEGGIYPSLEEAHAEAVQSARELLGAGLTNGRSLFHYSIHAIDEDGRTRFYLPFLDAVPVGNLLDERREEGTRFARGEAPG